MTLNELGARLEQEREEILIEWRQLARRDPQHAAQRLGLGDRRLDDHLPALIKKIADALRDQATPDVERDGDEHGHDRRELGYTITEILWELRLFRQVLLDHALRHGKNASTETSASSHVVDDARTLILDVIDRSLAASVRRYTLDTEAERNAAREKLEQRSLALEERDRQRNRFLAMLSHELRNPISAILSAVEILKQAQVAPHLARARDIINRQARYQAKLIDDLLEVNRIAVGKVELKKATVDCRDAVNQAVEACSGIIDAKSLHVEVALPDAPLFLSADPTRLVQIITNVVNNAAKFTPREGHIWISARQEDGYAVVRVRDDGIGIGPDMLPRVFEIFAQADTSLDRTAGGLGVGLAIAKSMVEQHGGRVEAFSAGLDAGAEFVIRLPVLLPDERTRPVAVPAGKVVAVVEDNPDSRVLLAEILESLGFAVVTAEDGNDALRLAQEKLCHAYVIDLGLPGMDGYEVARRIRDMQPAEHALLIALTGYGTPEDKEHAARAGFDYHMTKPPDFDTLERLLKSA